GSIDRRGAPQRRRLHLPERPSHGGLLVRPRDVQPEAGPHAARVRPARRAARRRARRREGEDAEPAEGVQEGREEEV
ncbi:MAG: hypothetical protein AVDCRST_MAG79-324, partial [uncultured Thermoleophilia bacterium]